MAAATVLSIQFLAISSSSTAHAITVAATTDGQLLVDSILGTGITQVGVPTNVGTTNQSATFSSGSAEVGFQSGIVLSTGNVNQIPGPNISPPVDLSAARGAPDVDTDLGLPGNPMLDVISGFPTFDANILSFDLKFKDGSVGGYLLFNFTFAFEKYIDFIFGGVNDSYGFFVDGANITLVGGRPISIPTINNTINSSSYVNNVDNLSGLANAGRDISFDGLTTVLTASMLGLSAGVHTIELKIADASDGNWDSGVFIQAGTFSSTPEPGSAVLVGLGLAGLGWRRRARLSLSSTE